jgi:hypothetical protein
LEHQIERMEWKPPCLHNFSYLSGRDRA